MVTVDHCYSIYYINSSYDSDDSDDSDDSWDSYCPDRLAPIPDPVRIRSQVARLEYVASREHTVKAQEACRSGTLGLFCTAFKKLGQGIR